MAAQDTCGGGQRAARAGDIPVSEALDAWRRRAISVISIAISVLHLPSLIYLFAGDGPLMPGLWRAAMSCAYAVCVCCAVSWRFSYRARARGLLSAGYLVAVVGGIALPQGLFMRTMPVILPLVTLVLLGARAGWFAVLLSGAVLMLTPHAPSLPCLSGLLPPDPPAPEVVRHAASVQGFVLVVRMLALMFLLDRFHHFLMQALSRLERETVERRKAYETLARETEARKRLECEVARIGEDERRRLGQEIHDGVCQQLTGALLRSEALVRRVDRGEIPASRDLSALSAVLGEAIDEARAVARGLCPLEPGGDALATALRALTRRVREASGISCSFEAVGHGDVPDTAAAQHLYRIAQEAVSNAVRHARAGRISVALLGGETELLLTVEDDGVGPPTDGPAEGMGLRSMAHRATLLGGVLTVDRAPGGGTRVTCRVPQGGPARPGGEQDEKESGHAF